MSRISTREAINMVLDSELERDGRTVYLGETLRAGGGATKASYGLYDRFGPKRVIETPVSENGFFGASLGLALSGFRPIIEIYAGDFTTIVANELINDIPKWRQQHGMAGAMPITVRGWMGSTLGLGPEHSQCVESFFHHAPGLIVLCPGTPADTAGLLRSAIRSDDPVLFFEHRRIYPMEDDVSDDPDYMLPIGSGEIIRTGEDVTLVAWSWMRHEAIAASESLAGEGISVELIDPRTIKPMDFDLIARSAARTGALVVAEEAPLTGNVGAEILARTMETAGRSLQVARVAMPDMIHPYSPTMEREILPHATLIAQTVRALLAGDCRGAAIRMPWEGGG